MPACGGVKTAASEEADEVRILTAEAAAKQAEEQAAADEKAFPKFNDDESGALIAHVASTPNGGGWKEGSLNKADKNNAKQAAAEAVRAVRNVQRPFALVVRRWDNMVRDYRTLIQRSARPTAGGQAREQACDAATTDAPTQTTPVTACRVHAVTKSGEGAVKTPAWFDLMHELMSRRAAIAPSTVINVGGGGGGAPPKGIKVEDLMEKTTLTDDLFGEEKKMEEKKKKVVFKGAVEAAAAAQAALVKAEAASKERPAERRQRKLVEAQGAAIAPLQEQLAGMTNIMKDIGASFQMLAKALAQPQQPQKRAAPTPTPAPTESESDEDISGMSIEALRRAVTAAKKKRKSAAADSYKTAE